MIVTQQLGLFRAGDGEVLNTSVTVMFNEYILLYSTFGHGKYCSHSQIYNEQSQTAWTLQHVAQNRFGQKFNLKNVSLQIGIQRFFPTRI